MQPIERYGVVALVFLVVTVVSVLLWDRDEESAPQEVAAAPTSEKPLTQTSGPGAGTSLVAMPPKKRPRALRRDQELEPTTVPAAATQVTPNAARQATPAFDDRPTQGPGHGAVAQQEVPRQSERAIQYNSRDEATPLRSTGPGAQAEEAPVRTLQRKNDVRDSGRVHVVAAGDTLSEISLERLGTSKRWKEIIDLNPGLDPAKMRVGARLRLPADANGANGANAAPAASKTSEPSSKKRSTSSGATGTYVIEPGDSLWKIAAATLGDGERWREIRDANPDLDAARLAVGQRIKLPAGARKATTTAAAPTVAKADTSSTRGGKVR